MNSEGLGETPSRITCRATPQQSPPASPGASPGASRLASAGASTRGIVRTLLAACVLLAAVPATLPAQDAEPDADPFASDPQTMTVEELERYIAEQRSRLRQVRENRDITAEKARRVREELARKEAERRAMAAELDTLCRERDALEPGSLEDCLAQIDDGENR